MSEKKERILETLACGCQKIEFYDPPGFSEPGGWLDSMNYCTKHNPQANSSTLPERNVTIDDLVKRVRQKKEFLKKEELKQRLLLEEKQKKELEKCRKDFLNQIDEKLMIQQCTNAKVIVPRKLDDEFFRQVLSEAELAEQLELSIECPNCNTTSVFLHGAVVVSNNFSRLCYECSK